MDCHAVRVSVIVLAYNHESYIQQALDSILRQKTNFVFEVLINDDASYDQTPRILQDYQMKYSDRVRIFLQQKNIGPTMSAYTLFQEAKGDYIATCEGDDFWIAEDKLQKQVDFLECHPQYIGCSHPCVIVDSTGYPSTQKQLDWECTKKVMTLRDFKGWRLPGQAATIVRRNLYRLHHDIDFSFFYKAHPFIGDRTTGLIYLSQGDFYRIDEAMSAYRVVHNDSSLSFKLYYNNRRWIEIDYEYTKKLMEFAEKDLRVKVNFHCYLRRLAVQAFREWFRMPTRTTWHLFVDIFKECGCPVLTLLVMAGYASKKLLKVIVAQAIKDRVG